MKRSGIMQTGSTHRNQGKAATLRNFERIGSDLLSALSALDTARSGMRHYVMQHADSHVQTAALHDIDKIVGSSVRGLLLAVNGIMVLDGIGQDLRRDHAEIQSRFDALLTQCGDIWTGDK